MNLLSLNQNRNNSPSTQTKGPMTQDPQNGRNFTGVRRHRHKRVLLGGFLAEKHLTQRLGAAHVLRSASLGSHAVPEVVFFAEAGFDGPVREEGVDVGFVVAMVAGVDADSFAE
jgi:hypothetical protein